MVARMRLARWAPFGSTSKVSASAAVTPHGGGIVLSGSF